MAIVAVLLDKVRNTTGLPSDNALGGRVGRSRQVVSQWRSGDAYPDQEIIAQLAKMAGEDPGAWLVAVQAERHTGAAGAAWAKLARQLGVAATLAVVTIGLFPAPAHAAMDSTLTASPYMHYAKSLAGWCAAWFAGSPPGAPTMDLPPCWPEGTKCPNACAAANYRRQVYNQTPLHGPWAGWRMAGQRLVAPTKEWVAPHQLDRWLWKHMRVYDYGT